MSLLSLFKTTSLAEPAPATNAAVAQETETLEDVLLELAKWGKPRVTMPSDKGWYSTVEVNITPIGAKFDVASEFGMATPLAAALQCRERLLAAVKAIGGAA